VSPVNAEDVAAADEDGDGKPDVVVTSSAGMCVLYGDGAGRFGPPVQYGVGAAPGVAPLHITTGSALGDGVLDVGVFSASQLGLNVFFRRRGP